MVVVVYILPGSGVHKPLARMSQLLQLSLPDLIFVINACF